VTTDEVCAGAWSPCSSPPPDQSKAGAGRRRFVCRQPTACRTCSAPPSPRTWIRTGRGPGRGGGGSGRGRRGSGPDAGHEERRRADGDCVQLNAPGLHRLFAEQPSGASPTVPRSSAPAARAGRVMLRNAMTDSVCTPPRDRASTERCNPRSNRSTSRREAHLPHGTG